MYIFVTFCFCQSLVNNGRKSIITWSINQDSWPYFGQIDLHHQYGIFETKTYLSCKIFPVVWSQEWWLHFKELNREHYSTGYRIYSIDRPGRLLNFWTLRVGPCLKWELIQGWALIKSSTSVVCLFCYNTINGNNKTWICKKARFLSNTQKKTPSSWKSLVSTCSSFLGEGGWGWALIWVLVGGGGAGYLLTFSAFRMGPRLGTYSNSYGTDFSVSTLRK